MSRRNRSTSSAEQGSAPSAEERKGKRAHDEHGNVRPADGRWSLHEPKDESKHVRTDAAPQTED